jgi:RNA polymerase sigma-70 factor (ECF subfamily)
MAASNAVPWESMRAMLKILAEGLMRRIPELRQRVDGSDLVQESLLKAEKAWGHLRSNDVQTIRKWLKGILHNVFKDTVAHALRECRSIDLEKSLHDAVDNSSQRLEKFLERQGSPELEQVLDLAAALEKLPVEDREILIAHDIEERSLRDIAAETGLNKNKVAAKLYQAQSKLRRMLKDYGQESKP